MNKMEGEKSKNMKVKYLKQQMQRQNLKKQAKGITLIALVITIIVLLILAGVTIATLTGENGILTRANEAKIEQSHGAIRDGISLAYNEYQIEIKTSSSAKIASREIVTIQGEKEQALASIYTSFLDFLVQKGYAIIDKENQTIGIIDVETLTGSRQSLGNGTDKDVYKIEEKDGSYVVSYYDVNGNSKEIWKTDLDIEESYKIGNCEVGESKVDFITLFNSEGEKVEFDKIYLVLNNERIDASKYIITENGYSYLSSIDLYEVFEELGREFWEECNFGNHEFVIEKDGQEYKGTAYVSWQVV